MLAQRSVSFRSFLQDELERRRVRNPRYSLRAFARDLGIDNSRLSKMLQGERPIGDRMLRLIGERLKLEPSEIDQFFKNELKGRSVRKDWKKLARTRRLVTIPDFVLGDPLYYTILELLNIKGFKSETEWVAKRLGEPKTRVDRIVRDLFEAGLLGQKADGGWVDLTEGATTNYPKVTTELHRKFQKRLLTESITSIDDVPFEVRDHSAVTMAVDVARIDEAKKMIRRFRREVSALLGAPSNSMSEVYHVTVSLFPATILREHQ